VKWATTESRIKVNDILVGAFLFVIITTFLTAMVYGSISNSIEQMPFVLSLVVSLEIVELILIMYLLYRRQIPVEREVS
jgi:hypothetical protein